MEMNMAKFSEKLVELLELAKKKKNVLEYQEISDFFKDSPLEVDQMRRFLTSWRPAVWTFSVSQKTAVTNSSLITIWIWMGWKMKKR